MLNLKFNLVYLNDFSFTSPINKIHVKRTNGDKGDLF